MSESLAQIQARHTRLRARRAQHDYEVALADTATRRDALRTGLALREASLAALDRLLDAWLADLSGVDDETRAHAAMSHAAHECLSALAAQVRQAPVPLPALAEAYNRGAQPREVLSVSRWAERHRWLRSGTNSPGPWRNELTPYLVEIMDSLSEHSPAREVTFIKSSGVGGTEALYNWIGYVMHHLQNKDLLVVVPTLELRDRSFNPRLSKVLEESPSLAPLAGTAQRNRSNRSDLLEYGSRSRIIKAGANSPDSLRSDHLPYVICDEVDAFPWDVGGEGDPMSLIANRQRTFSRAKTYCVSTPTLEGSSRIAQLYARSDRRRYHVPCPHCHGMQPLEFGTPGAAEGTAHGLRWRLVPETEGLADGRRVASAWYVCRECGGEIREHHKPAMLAAGRWVAERPQVRLHRGYHLNALYAPVGLGLGWAAVAQKWIDSQGDTAELKAFVNTYLGEVWREEGDGVEPMDLLSRVEDYEATSLPLQCITAGVDCQKNRLEITIVGWGAGEEAWILDHHIIPGDTAAEEPWHELAELLEECGVHIAAIDEGYNTSLVRAFCAPRAWAIAVKGLAGAGRPLVEDEKRRRQRLRKRARKSAATEPVGVDQAKALIYSRLKLSRPGPGYMHFPRGAGIDDEYMAQLAAERLQRRLRGSRPVLEWVQLRPRNEALDCLVYALAARRLADLPGQRLRKALRAPAGASVDADADDQPLEQPTAPAPATAPPAPRRPAPVIGPSLARGRIQLGSGGRFGGSG